MFFTFRPLKIDFMIQDGSRIVPIEVKSEENLKSKSLSAFLGQNANAHGVWFSMSPYREQERMTNVPLYGAGVWFGRGWCKAATGAPPLLKCPCGYEIPFGRAMLRFPADVVVFGNAVFFSPW